MNDSGHASQPEPQQRQNVPGSLEEILEAYANADYWGEEGWTAKHQKDAEVALPKALAALEQYTLRQTIEEIEELTVAVSKLGVMANKEVIELLTNRHAQLQQQLKEDK